MAEPGCDPEVVEQFVKAKMAGKEGETEIVPISIDAGDVLQNPSAAVTQAKFGLFFPVRTARGAWGDEMAVRAVDPLQMMDIRANNFVSKHFRTFKEDTKEIRRYFRGLSKEKDAEMDVIADNMVGSKYQGPPAMYDDATIRAAEKWDATARKLASENSVDYDLFRAYRKLIAQKPAGIFHRPNLEDPAEIAFRERLTPSQAKFYEEVERKGVILDAEQTATSSYVHLVRSISNSTIRKPTIAKIEAEVVNPHFGVKFIRGAGGGVEVVANDGVGFTLWKELVHNVMGGPTPFDKTMTMTVKSLFGMFGKEADTHTLYKISHGLTSLFYSGVMGGIGGRPSSIIRQFFQIVPTYAELGTKYTAIGLQRTMSKDPRHGIKALQDMNLITSPIDGLAETVGLARGAGRAISDISELSLRLFGKVDQFTRAATAHGAAAKFEDYAARDILHKLPGKAEFKQEMARLLAAGKEDEAKLRYMFETVANLQYIYGKANRPAMFRGALGNMASTLMSYPMNSFEMVRMFGKRFGAGAKEGDLQEMLPMMRLTFATLALTYAGSEFLHADMRSAFVLGAMPHSLAFPKTAMDTIQLGTSTAEWLSASLFNIGETDYHKHQRAQHWAQFSRDMRTFVPGYIFFGEDIPRAIDEGSLTRMLAMTPKADVINQQARERQALKRRETREASGQTTGGLATLGGLKGLQ